MSILNKIINKLQKIDQMYIRLQEIQEALGRIENRQARDSCASSLAENEFKVYSQWGEDGILQHLLRHVPVAQRVFVEFGVESYVESNTRFLLVNNNWSGLVIDGCERNISFIKKDPLYWKYNLKADCAFITRENIDTLFERNGIQGEIGLLSIDIDGNDYWVWENIQSISPAIVVVEYNSLFGNRAIVSIPYNPSFQRNKAHYSNLYFGASLRALCELAKKKGYIFVGSNEAGCNAFFVRRDLCAELTEISPEDGYRKIQFRQSRNMHGELDFLDFEAGQSLLHDLPVFDFEVQTVLPFKAVLNRWESV